MSCYHPMRAIKTFNPEHLFNQDVPEFTYRVLKGSYDPDEECKVPNSKYIPLPCGRCIGCRLDYSRTWADRCMLEASYHTDNIFLTLTYNDECLPKPLEGSKIHPLVKRDVQLFIKRLRRVTGQKIRYFAAGEYSPAMRPHYHLIIFGLRLEDLKIHHKDMQNGFTYYVSPTIDHCWYPEEDDKKMAADRRISGFHIISNVSWDTCAYTARYVMKKQKGKGSEIYEKYNFPPEFTLMSRRPGIANQFYVDHNDIVVKDFYMPTSKGFKKIKSNKYFDKLFDVDYPSDLEFIKEDRQRIAEANAKMKNNLTSLSYQEQLLSDEINKEAAIKVLKRKGDF